MRLPLIALLSLVSTCFFSATAHATDCGSLWAACQQKDLVIGGHAARIRMGYVAESSAVPFRGNIVYFEGLGDSMLNHDRLFAFLAGEGYRVIAFDYMGQGGSTGKMSHTRVKEIWGIGAAAWGEFSREPSRYPQRTVLGWSTGGLAAYYAASQNDGFGRSIAERVILIAPGIATKSVLKITKKTLTSAARLYGRGEIDPHVEAPSPSSPAQVLPFANDLVQTAAEARGAKGGVSAYVCDAYDLEKAWKIPASVQGLVFLSGERDVYVGAETTRKVVEAQPGFRVVQYADALHEIDNEVAPIREKLYAEIGSFLKATDVRR